MKKYRFTQEVEARLTVFEKYLQSKNYAKGTIRQTRNYAGIFLEKLEGIEVETVDYKMLTDFIFQLKKEKTDRQINRIILAVRHYYTSLKVEKNPASGIRIRTTRSRILNEIIDYKKLPKLYENYPTKTDRDKRNKVMLGLFIYQAITSGGLPLLEPKHLNLQAGKIYVPSSGNTESRTLKLASAQLFDLQEYLLIIRPRMLENLKNERPGRKPKAIDPSVYERLFFSENGRLNLKDSLLHLFRKVQKTHPEIKNGKLIRATVIAEWLKEKDLRIVQNMAGHRWVSSTEKYNAYNLEELKDALKKHHPLS